MSNIYSAVSTFYNICKSASIQSDMADRIMYSAISALDHTAIDNPILIDKAVNSIKETIKLTTKICIEESAHIISESEYQDLLEEVDEDAGEEINELPLQLDINLQDYKTLNNLLVSSIEDIYSGTLSIPEFNEKTVKEYIYLLEELEELFMEDAWSRLDKYGGKSWSNIAKKTKDICIAYDQYMNEEDDKKKIALGKEVIWRIDHLDDVIHNTGQLMNKIINKETKKMKDPTLLPLEYQTEKDLYSNNTKDLMDSKNNTNTYETLYMAESMLDITLPYQEYLEKLRSTKEYQNAKNNILTQKQNTRMYSEKYEKEKVSSIINLVKDISSSQNPNAYQMRKFLHKELPKLKIIILSAPNINKNQKNELIKSLQTIQQNTIKTIEILDAINVINIMNTTPINDDQQYDNNQKYDDLSTNSNELFQIIIKELEGIQNKLLQ